jgi:drug/metabolite transporter (DMT)-like permease
MPEVRSSLTTAAVVAEPDTTAAAAAEPDTSAAAATAADRRRVRGAIAALLLGAVAIGFAPILVRLSELGPVATAFHRMLFSLPALWLWYAIECRRPSSTPAAAADRPGFLAAGLCFAGDLAIWHWSLAFTSVANATLFPNFAPVFVTLAGLLFFGERFSRTFLAGMGLAIAGAVVLMGASFDLGPRHLLGDGLALATALFYAGYILAVGRLRGRHGTAKIMAWSGLITCVCLLPVAVASGESLIAPSLEGWLVLAALGLFSHALGQSLIAYALAHLPAAFSSVALLLQPAVAAVLAWVLFAEALGPWQAAGAVVILAGIALARRGSRR